MLNWMRRALALGTVGLLAACGGGGDGDPVVAPPALATIAATATGNASLSGLVAAANKAGLVSALADTSANITVLAPTNAAFNTLATQLGLADATALVNALPAATLAQILQYHVIPGRFPASTLSTRSTPLTTALTLSGTATTLAVSTSPGVGFTDAVLARAAVTTPDVNASNGVVHVIDKVLIPPGVLNVVQMALANPAAFSSLTNALTNRNLVTTLSGTGPFTVFAPTNAAFTAAAGVINALPPAQLDTALLYHVLGSRVLSSGIPFGTAIPTLAAGKSFTITAGGTGGAIASITDSTATPARIIAVDVLASNGVIHVIDKVLVPTLP